MHPRRSAPLSHSAVALALLGLAFAGCQTPKHSNVLVFGTNTRAGLSVGYDPKLQNGSILVGYDRQEAVWMPLLANTNARGDAPAISEKVTVKDSLYVGSDGKATDAYSVLASFGGNFDAEAASGGSKTGGGIVQFFATGLAARTLAERGGADLVSLPTDEAAKARKAEADARKAEVEKTTAALDGQRAAVSSARDRILAYAGTLTDDKLGPLVNAAQQKSLIAAGTTLSSAADQRAALNKFLNAGDDDQDRRQALESLAADFKL